MVVVDRVQFHLFLLFFLFRLFRLGAKCIQLENDMYQIKTALDEIVINNRRCSNAECAQVLLTLLIQFHKYL